MMLVRKVTVAQPEAGSLEFVISDGTRDRYNSVIEPQGWVLKNFLSNPIALFNHNPDFPVGFWRDVRVEGGRLLGRLELAAEGTSQRLDEIIRLVRQGILRAVSVGFGPIRAEELADGGMRYVKQELFEASLVAVGGNANAVIQARALNVSDETIATVFGKNASTAGAVSRGLPAEHGVSSSPRKSNPMNAPIAVRIESEQANLVSLQDQLRAHLDQDDADQTVTDELTVSVEQSTNRLAGLKRAEAALGATALPVVQRATQPHSAVPVADIRRPFAMPKRELKPIDYFYRSAVIAALAKVKGEPLGQVRKDYYGDDEMTRAVLDNMVTRAASTPATTTTAGWAAELVETAYVDFLDTLAPLSVYPRLAAMGQKFNFGRAGKISVPSRLPTPTLAGSFVGEGAPIPVRQGAFQAITLTPKKMAVISTMTREIAEHSTPAIEGMIRNAINEDTAVAIDTVLLDASAATTIRPAGLRNGVAATTATAGGGFAALVGDVKLLVGVLTAANSLRVPVWIMNPVQALSAGLTQNAGGDFPFQAELNGGRFAGFPVITSTTVGATVVILMDAADFVSVTGDVPRFDVSDQATLHMEDTTPLAIGTAGAPATVAAPARSLWQTDSLGIRMIMDLNWAMRRTGVIAHTTAVTW